MYQYKLQSIKRCSSLLPYISLTEACVLDNSTNSNMKDNSFNFTSMNNSDNKDRTSNHNNVLQLKLNEKEKATSDMIREAVMKAINTI